MSFFVNARTLNRYEDVGVFKQDDHVARVKEDVRYLLYLSENPGPVLILRCLKFREAGLSLINSCGWEMASHGAK